MASYSLKRIVPITSLADAASTLYTVTAPKTSAVIKQILLSNTSASSMTVTLHLVAPAGAVSTANMLFPAVTISPNSVMTVDITQVMLVGETLQGFASATGTVNIMASGYEVE